MSKYQQVEDLMEQKEISLISQRKIKPHYQSMNTQEDSVFFLRYKRDQYLVDIRKQKNDQFIMAKRMKLTQGSSDNRSETSGSTRPSAASNDPIKEFRDYAQSFSNALQSEDYELIAEVAECIRRAISREGNPPLEPLANTEILVYIIRMLDPQFYEYEKLMVESSWIIANVASGPTVFVDYLVSLDIITKVINLLEHPSAEVKENAVWILANIAGELNEYRDVLLERDIVSKIHRLVKENNLNIPLLIQLTWLIANLVGGKVPPNFELIAPLLKDLQNFLFYYDNEEIVSHTLWAFSHISNTDEQDIQHILSLNPCEKIIGYLRSKEPYIKIPALRTVGNLLTGNDQQMDILLRHGVVEALVPLLDHSRKIIRKETCWALSNIMAGTEKQIEEVFQFRNGVIVKKLFMMIESEDAEVAKECVFCLTNATSAGTLQHITKLVSFGLIEMIVEMLKRNNEVKVLKACLEALEIVLNEFKTNVYRNNNYENNEILERIARCGGYMVIEDLQTHQDNGIYAMISRLIESHFDFD